jgi:vancomycin permeability regulator SanA
MYGLPEAKLMKAYLIDTGVPETAIRAESRSIDTVTNFLRSEFEGFFGDTRPVAIVAQEAHLQRILSIIAPQTLRRPYIGVVVPQTNPEEENRFANLASRVVVSHLPSDCNRAIAHATARANFIWSALRLSGMRSYH